MIVVGGTGPIKLAYSHDGVQWNSSNNPDCLFEDGACLAIAHNESVWVAGGTGVNKLGFSEDGITWNICSGVDVSRNWRCITIGWNGSYFLAGGDDDSPEDEIFLYSTDGKNWSWRSETTVLFDNSCNILVSNDTMWLTGGSGTHHRMGYSMDGIVWIPSSSGNELFTLCHTIAWNGALWVAGGMGACTLAYSINGIDWTSSDFSLFTNCTTLAWNGTLWIAGGEGHTKLAHSKDGIHWFPLQSPFHISVVCVTWTGELWLAGGGEIERVNIAKSTDGIVWEDTACTLFGVEGSCRAFGNKIKE